MMMSVSLHYLLRLLFVEPEILVADIAVDRHDL